MSVQNRANVSNLAFVLFGNIFTKFAVIFKQISGRSTDLVKYTLMGIQRVVSAITPVADEGNTGDGTCTLATVVGLDTLGNKVLPTIGTWTFELTAALIGKLTDPSGVDIVTGIALNDGSTTVVKYAGLQFTITDGSTAFVSGDKFTLPVVADGDYVPYDPENVLGAAVPAGIYVGDDIAAADIAAGDVTDVAVYIGGNCTIDSDQLVLENGALTDIVPGTNQSVEDVLANLGIFIENTVAGSGFENS